MRVEFMPVKLATLRDSTWEARDTGAAARSTPNAFNPASQMMDKRTKTHFFPKKINAYCDVTCSSGVG
jgi:hypothetical protein